MMTGLGGALILTVRGIIIPIHPCVACRLDLKLMKSQKVNSQLQDKGGNIDTGSNAEKVFSCSLVLMKPSVG